jgi:hypothetical protein
MHQLVEGEEQSQLHITLTKGRTLDNDFTI